MILRSLGLSGILEPGRLGKLFGGKKSKKGKREGGTGHIRIVLRGKRVE
jgi:hypothetical protein